MCARYTLTTKLEILQERFGFYTDESDIAPRFNLAPSQDAPVVIEREKRSLQMLRWGLVPYWAKDPKIGYKMINARGETIHEKPSFKTPLKIKRCLVLADGFYEWNKTEDGNKVPLRFVLKMGGPFAFAGLWDYWKNPDGADIISFTIITTGANEIMKPIHDRMPVILRSGEEDVWLDPNLNDEQKLLPLLKPYPSDEMRFYEVSTLVNSPQNDVPKCIEPLEKQ